MARFITKEELAETIEEALRLLKRSGVSEATLAIQTGSGQIFELRGFELKEEIPFEKIKAFPYPRAKGHSGRLILYEKDSKKVIQLRGRSHFYEGYEGWEVAMPVRILHRLGVSDLIITNASGALTHDYEVGDVVLINDFLDFSGANPLRGIEGRKAEIEFPSIRHVASPKLLKILKAVSQEQKVRVKSGTYAMVAGPRYESDAEKKMLATLGATLVGMSTLPELITANALGMGTLALSLVTNVAIESPTSHSEVLKASEKGSGILGRVITALVERYFEIEN